jgi:hypothetical protein
MAKHNLEASTTIISDLQNLAAKYDDNFDAAK